MLLLAVDVIVVVPWYIHRDVRVFCLGIIFRCRDSAAVATPLPPMKCWSSSLGVSYPPSMCEAFRCVDFGHRFSHCLAVVWTL